MAKSQAQPWCDHWEAVTPRPNGRHQVMPMEPRDSLTSGSFGTRDPERPDLQRTSVPGPAPAPGSGACSPVWTARRAWLCRFTAVLRNASPAQIPVSGAQPPALGGKRVILISR